MIRSMLLLPAWWFLKIIPTTIPAIPAIPAFAADGGSGGAGSYSVFAEYGLGIGMVLLIAGLWREDRKSRIEYQTEADKRYAALVEQLKDIIGGNTRAMTTLADNLTGKVVSCPLSQDPAIGRWLHSWFESRIQEAPPDSPPEKRSHRKPAE